MGARARWIREGTTLLLVGAALCGCRPDDRAAPPPGAAAQGAARAVGLATRREPADAQILFGDLHVHTTFSIDAWSSSLPIVQGEGVHPPADACDFARYCSALDFWSINDHAEDLTPDLWRETRRAVAECNARAGDPADPELVTFLGWEWTQVGATPASHFGHRNVVLREAAEGRVPERPIGSREGAVDWSTVVADLERRARNPRFDADESRAHLDFARHLEAVSATPACPTDVPVRELAPDCMEGAATPEVLHRKLDEWGFDALVVPHGTAWGNTGMPGISFENRLDLRHHRPARDRLIEVYSGHGSSEVFRDFASASFDAEGRAHCPAPSGRFVPCCHRAGELIEERCLAEGRAGETCEGRAAIARRRYLEAGPSGFLTVPGASLDDWGMCGQCRDCFLPAYDYRPRASVQAALALSRFVGGGDADPLRFRFGLIASSDDHSARAGTGYKEVARPFMIDARGARSRHWSLRGGFERRPEKARAASRAVAPGPADRERAASFFYTGGLVAVHATGRDRDSIWNALDARRVYGTSGDRILLWFDLLNPPGGDGPAPMGSEWRMADPPRFRVRAVGAFAQQPGCPEHAQDALGADRLRRLCRGECHQPSDRRRRIARIEVVRIRPQAVPDEPLPALIEDPWRVFDCEGDPSGCVVEFSDDAFPGAGRDALYYVRALQEPTPAINGDTLRCLDDDAGRCVEVRPCFGGYRTDPDDDCLAPVLERAWSSPIFVDHVDAPGTTAAGGRRETPGSGQDGAGTRAGSGRDGAGT